MGGQVKRVGVCHKVWLNSSRMHDTIFTATVWASMHSLEFSLPRVDPPIITCFSTSAPAGVRESGLLVYLCVWGDPVPYQGSAPPKCLIRAIIKGTAPLHSQLHSQTLHWE